MKSIYLTLAVLSAAVAYGFLSPEPAAADSHGCAGVAASGCSGVAAPASVGCGGQSAVAYRRVGFFERLRARRAERRAARAVYYVPVQAAVGCGG